jgi:protein phosphatase PTC6
VFDGHGGVECSEYLKERLHAYIEGAAVDFDLRSSLRAGNSGVGKSKDITAGEEYDTETMRRGKEALKNVLKGGKDVEDGDDGPVPSEPTQVEAGNFDRMQKMEKELIKGWRELVSGYWRRAKPPYFSIFNDVDAGGMKRKTSSSSSTTTIEEVLSYSFLKADFDFVSAQAALTDPDADSVHSERPLNDGDILGVPHQVASHVKSNTDTQRFKGGSTCSIAMVSTPSPVPFWNPASTSTLIVAHVGDTRILLSSTATGSAHPLTTNHHPSSPIEATRLRRYAATFVTDSFGEERISGLANTRAFGDIASKRIGVSAEPEITRIELSPAEYAFMVLVSDGVSGTLGDQEIVDIVKEARTAEEAARRVVDFATEVSQDGDNATCLVVRLGGWERRQEGGVGSLGTKEARDFKREQASDPRSSRR